MMRTLLAALLFAGAVHAAEPAAPACPPSAELPDPAALQAAMESPTDRGFLWRITKAGRTSYLYGTIHVGRLAWLVPGPTIAAALRDTQTLALEIDFLNPEIAAAATSMTAAGPDAPTLSEKLRARLDRQIAAACLPAAALATVHPVMQAITLTTLAGRWDGLDPSFAQEVVLGGAARALEHRVVSLESIQLQMEALIPKDEETALELIDETLEQLEENKVRPLLQHLGKVWENGDLEALERYEEWCGCASTDEEREFLKRLNDGRNPHLAAGIDALHLGGETVFAAVGALHMVGPQSLPKLLAQRGYAVARVALPR